MAHARCKKLPRWWLWCNKNRGSASRDYQVRSSLDIAEIKTILVGASERGSAVNNTHDEAQR